MRFEQKSKDISGSQRRKYFLPVLALTGKAICVEAQAIVRGPCRVIRSSPVVGVRA